jgi:two-component system, NarL family, sensor histidine kinase ComP
MTTNRSFLGWQGSFVFGGSVVYLYFILTILTGTPVFDRFYGGFSPLIFSLLSVAFWGSGLWAYLSSDYRPTVFLFYLWNLTSALVILTGALQQHYWLSWSAGALGGLCNPTLMYQTLRFKLAENDNRRPVWTKFLTGWYVLNVGIFGLAALDYFGQAKPAYWSLHIGDFAFVIGNFANLIWLVYLLRRLQGALVRNQIRTVLIGLAIPGLPIICLNLVPRLITGQPIVPVEGMLPLAIATPLCFYYAIKQQQWLQADLQLSRWLIIGSVFGIVGIVYLQLVFGFTYLSQKLVLNDTFILGLVSIVLAGLAYAPLRKRVEQYSERAIYGSNYDYREIVRELNTNLFGLATTREIGNLVCGKLRQTLNVRGVALVIRDSETANPVLSASAGTFDKLTVAQLEHLAECGNVRPTPEWCKDTGTPILCQPVYHKGQLRGFLLLSAKVGGNMYGKTDFYLLETVAASLGIALENSLLLDRLREQITQLQQAREEASSLNRQLTLVRDEEREALAYQLHDGVLQNLIFITRQSTFCAGLLSFTGEAKKSVEEQLDNLHNVAHSSIQELRSICNGLYPIAVDTVGLLTALRWFCTNMEETHGVSVGLDVGKIPGDARWASSIERALFLTIQEAVKNSLKHAQADRINVCLRQQAGELQVLISDNGVGLSPGWDYQQFAFDGHMGLVGMRMRIERLGGHFRISSTAQEGTHIFVELSPNLLGEITPPQALLAS